MKCGALSSVWDAVNTGVRNLLAKYESGDELIPRASEKAAWSARWIKCLCNFLPVPPFDSLPTRLPFPPLARRNAPRLRWMTRRSESSSIISFAQRLFASGFVTNNSPPILLVNCTKIRLFFLFSTRLFSTYFFLFQSSENLGDSKAEPGPLWRHKGCHVPSVPTIFISSFKNFSVAIASEIWTIFSWVLSAVPFLTTRCH